MPEDLFGFEPLEIPAGAFDPISMSRGEPGAPRRLRWKGETVAVVRVEVVEKRTGRDRGGSSERYVDRHYFRLTLESGTVLHAYFERRPARAGAPRWWARELR